MNIQNNKNVISKTVSTMSIRQLVDSIGHNIITTDNNGEIFIGILVGVNVNTKNELLGLTVKTGKEKYIWRENYLNAVFA